MSTRRPDRCLHDAFAEQVQRTPDAPALVDDAVTLTYAELDGEAERLAAHLRARGVGPDVLVGVLMERRAEYVIACLAALKAGGAFLVLELAYPPALLADVLADADPLVVVTVAAQADRLDSGRDRIVIDADDQTPPPAPARPVVRPDPESLAFVSYSSGTTGRPKGIANPHRAAWQSYQWRFDISDQRPGDRVACNVFFIWEMLRPLLRGATVHVVADDVVYDPVALVRFLREQRITETLVTPSLLEAVLARVPDLGEQLPDLRVLWLNGEIVTPTLAERVLAVLPGARVLNVYSTSETHEVAAGDLREAVDPGAAACLVGHPMDPDHTYVLDPDDRPVAPGVEGELHVGGRCLARGYLNLPERTAEAFVDDPFDPRPGARMYRTGDRARLTDDGQLAITGRVGSMVKIRGYSVEPGAVENAIVQALAVRSCVVVADGEGGDDRRLVAYITRDTARRPDDDRVDDWQVGASGRSPGIRRVLSDRLPHYMIPSAYVEVDVLPVHASGKIDMGRLPPPPARTLVADDPAVDAGDGAVDAGTMTRMWAAVLDVPADDIATDDDFFELGGHSLAVAELGARIADTFDVDVALAELVTQPTPADHAALVARHTGAGDEPVGAHAAPAVDFGSEAVLDDDIQPRAHQPTPMLDDAGVVLLTGATGFLGGYLLDAILRGTDAKVVCPVRGGREHSVAAATRRLHNALGPRGLVRSDLTARCRVVPADLARPLLGLDRDGFDALAREVDVIVHAGATVNLVYPYVALRDVNVGGTREILRLACRGGATPVHFVSTNGVLPPSRDAWAEDSALDDVVERLADGYSQSKWVAEQLVHAAGRRGLPVRVYRPGTISGHSRTGVANERDLLGALISESLRLGHAPAVDGWYAEMTPVDYVSDAICALAGDADNDDRIFHLGDPRPLSARTLFARFAQLGYHTEHVGWDDWVARWRAHHDAHVDVDPVHVLRGGMPSADDLRSVTVLDDRATRQSLRRHGLQRPAIDADLLAAYTAHFYERGWLDRPPRWKRAGVA